MKRLSWIWVAVALAGLAMEATAHPLGGTRCTRETSALGSAERTKLLQQAGRGGRCQEEVLRLGSVARRAALTGRTVQQPRPLSERNGSLRVRGQRR